MPRPSGCLLLCVAVLLFVPGTGSRADPVSDGVSSHLPSDARLVAFRLANGTLLDLSAAPERTLTSIQPVGLACAAATRTTRRGLVYTELSESTFCDGEVSYRFDPKGWTARVRGAVAAKVETVRYTLSHGERKILSESTRPGRIRLDVSWAGTGPIRTTPEVGVGVCYFTVVCAAGRVTRSRDALVSGSLAFTSLGLDVRLPLGQRGSLDYHLGTY
jgi:hypothetical protein